MNIKAGVPSGRPANRPANKRRPFRQAGWLAAVLLLSLAIASLTLGGCGGPAAQGGTEEPPEAEALSGVEADASSGSALDDGLSTSAIDTDVAPDAAEPASPGATGQADASLGADSSGGANNLGNNASSTSKADSGNKAGSAGKGSKGDSKTDTKKDTDKGGTGTGEKPAADTDKGGSGSDSGSTGKKDRYNTDPTPPGKPKPVEPQDVKPTQKKLTCTLSIDCLTILDNIDRLNPEKAGLVPEDGIIMPKKTVTFYEGESVFDVLKRETRAAKLHMEFVETPVYNSAYIEGIHNLYEFDCGELSGWMYQVNGWYPNYGSSRYLLKAGDNIEWRYTCDLGRDVGGFYAVG